MSWGVMSWNGVIDEGWRKGPWTAEEDRLLIQYVRSHGEGRWNSVARLSGLKRNGKSCRLRWVNYLRPDLKRGQITPHEESIILELHARWGNRWSTIARSLPGRTDNEIKNYWRTHFKKKAKSAPEKAARTRLLKRQQFQQQQQQQQQLSQLEMKKMASLLEENKAGYVPQLRQQEMAAGLYTNTTTATTTAQQQQDYGFLQSVFNGSNSGPEENCISVEENMNMNMNMNMLWDGLWWNMDDVHGHFKPAMHTNNYNLLAPFC